MLRRAVSEPVSCVEGGAFRWIPSGGVVVCLNIEFNLFRRRLNYSLTEFTSLSNLLAMGLFQENR